MSKTVDVFYRLSVTDRASAGFRKVADGSRAARKDVEKLEGAAEEAGDAIEEAFDGDAVEGLSEELDKARRKTRQLGDEAKGSGRGFEGMAKSAKGALKAIAAAEVTKFFVKQGKAAVAAAADIESYQATLETMLGSTQAARDRMEEYKDIAKITPFGLSDVVEGGNQLQAIGRYSRQNLEMLGDLAAATNKPMEQVMNAYAKLATGQKGEAARMFQDLLISRNDWIEATGKGVSKSGELLASTEEMMAALPKIMQSKGFFGMMAKQAEKANGMFSNLEDSVFSLRAALGERMMPTVKNVTTGLTKMAESMERAVRIPLEQKIRDEKIGLNLLVGALQRSWSEEDERNRLISEITSKYPEFLKGIDLEKEGLQGVKDKLIEVNAEYDKKIKKAIAEEKLERWKEKYDDVKTELDKAEMADEAIARRRAIVETAMGEEGAAIVNPKAVDITGARKDRKGQYFVKVLMNDKLGRTKSVKVPLPGLTDEMLKDYRSLYKYTTAYRTDAGKKKMTAKAEEAKREQDLIMELAGLKEEDKANPGGTNPDEKKADTSGTTGETTVGGTTYSGGGSGSSGGSGKTVTTNIGTLVGTIEIHTTTLQEGAAEVKRLVTQALLEAVPSDL
ncbi:MAG: hypothetical protein IJ524_03390 [Bacteroidales bacterium]|nr:hypothetical protein [Bacteroidales bacterium]